MNELIAFESEGKKIAVSFIKMESFSCDKTPSLVATTYCTISVCNPNRKFDHYHAGTVCNPKDAYNERTGKFIAFKKALRLRWEDKYYKYPEWAWKRYHKFWSHFIAASMDGQVIDIESANKLFDEQFEALTDGKIEVANEDNLF